MSSVDYKPILRWPLDVTKTNHNDKSFVVLRDQSGVAPEPAMIPEPLMAIVSMFDGCSTVRDIVSVGEQYGVTLSLVSQLVEQLSRMGFLETEETKKRWDRIRKEFSELEIRKASLVNKLYPEKSHDVRKMISKFVSESGFELKNKVPSSQTTVVVSPHIDYQRGWKTYAAVSEALKSISRPDLILLIGTGHQLTEDYFSICNKGFESSFGVFPFSSVAFDIFKQATEGEEFLVHQICHKEEHALELQLPFLGANYAKAGEGLPEIFPVLVGSFHNHLATGSINNSRVNSFINGLGAILEDFQKNKKKVLQFLCTT